MKTIKDKKLITDNFLKLLREWIVNHQESFFAEDNQAVEWHDFVFWPDIKTDRNHLIMNGEICIVDRDWQGEHAYVICQFYGEKRKIRDLFKVIAVEKLDRSKWRNGYFLIPDVRMGEV